MTHDEIVEALAAHGGEYVHNEFRAAVHAHTQGPTRHTLIRLRLWAEVWQRKHDSVVESA